MFEPLLLTNSYTHTLRPVRSRASTLAKKTRKASRVFAAAFLHATAARSALLFFAQGLSRLATSRHDRLPTWFGIRTNFGGRFYADSAGCTLGRFSHWWRSVWVSVFGERGFHTSVALASTVLLGCQKRGNCTLGQLTSPRSESVFFASFLCRFGQRNDVPPRTVANSDKEKIRLSQTTNAESSNPALTPTTNTGT